MKNTRIAGLLGFCFLVGFVLVAAIAGCSPSETSNPELPPANTTTDSTETNETTVTDIAVAKVEPQDTVDTVAPAGPESLFAFKLDDKGNPIIDGGDWAQWGGTSYRNNTPEATGIPIDWSVGRLNRETGVWANQKNIKWVSPVGSQTYGNPVVSGGKVLVGTNNSGGYLARYSAKTCGNIRAKNYRLAACMTGRYKESAARRMSKEIACGSCRVEERSSASI